MESTVVKVPTEFIKGIMPFMNYEMPERRYSDIRTLLDDIKESGMYLRDNIWIAEHEDNVCLVYINRTSFNNMEVCVIECYVKSRDKRGYEWLSGLCADPGTAKILKGRFGCDCNHRLATVAEILGERKRVRFPLEAGEFRGLMDMLVETYDISIWKGRMNMEYPLGRYLMSEARVEYEEQKAEHTEVLFSQPVPKNI